MPVCFVKLNYFCFYLRSLLQFPLLDPLDLFSQPQIIFSRNDIRDEGYDSKAGNKYLTYARSWTGSLTPYAHHHHHHHHLPTPTLVGVTPVKTNDSLHNIHNLEIKLILFLKEVSKWTWVYMNPKAEDKTDTVLYQNTLNWRQYISILYQSLMHLTLLYLKYV